MVFMRFPEYEVGYNMELEPLGDFIFIFDQV